jgi:hypothetical protein
MKKTLEIQKSSSSPFPLCSRIPAKHNDLLWLPVQTEYSGASSDVVAMPNSEPSAADFSYSLQASISAEA